jgi:hypothetical protein
VDFGFESLTRCKAPGFGLHVLVHCQLKSVP